MKKVMAVPLNADHRAAVVATPAILRRPPTPPVFDPSTGYVLRVPAGDGNLTVNPPGFRQTNTLSVEKT